MVGRGGGGGVAAGGHLQRSERKAISRGIHTSSGTEIVISTEMHHPPSNREKAEESQAGGSCLQDGVIEHH